MCSLSTRESLASSEGGKKEGVGWKRVESVVRVSRSQAEWSFLKHSSLLRFYGELHKSGLS